MKNREFRTLLAVVTLTGTLLFGMTAGALPVYAADTSVKPYKSETVYAAIDGDGTVQDITVSDQLKNISGAKEVEDESGLDKIENVKGDETFKDQDGALVWDTKGKDICYQGTTTKALPVGVKVTYQLDGKEMKAEELTGKSGHLVIRYTYENHSGETSGKTIPFLMATGLVLDGTTFENVTVTNGRLLSDGEREMAVGFGIPALSEMLGTDAVDIPDSFEVEADVTDYEPVEGLTIATNSLFNDLKTDGFGSLAELKGSMGQLESASEELVGGSGELAKGLDTLLSSSGTMTSGIAQLAAGGVSLADGTKRLTYGAGNLENGLRAAADKVSGELLPGIQALDGGMTQMQNNLTNGLPSLTSGVSALNSGVRQVADGTAVLEQGVSKLKGGVDGLSTGIEGLSTLLKTLAGSQSAQGSGADGQATLSEDLSGLAGELYAASEQAGQISTVVYPEDTGTSSSDEIATLQALADATTDEATRNGIYEVINSLSNDQSLRDSAAGVPVTLDTGDLPTTLATLAGKAEALSGTAGTDTENAQAVSLDAAIKLVDDQLIPGMDALEKAIDGEGVNPGIVTAVGQLNAALNVGNAGTGTPSLKEGAFALNQAVNGKGGLAEQLTGGVSQLKTGTSKLVNGVGGEQGLAKGLDLLDAGALQLTGGSEDLNRGANTLASGIGTLQNGAGALVDGVQQLDDGAVRLNEGMIQFNEEGIQKLVEAFSGDIGKLLDTANEMLSASKDYNNFSGITDEMDGEVKFVFVTE